jgi:hypothetical protein
LCIIEYIVVVGKRKRKKRNLTLILAPHFGVMETLSGSSFKFGIRLHIANLGEWLGSLISTPPLLV